MPGFANLIQEFSSERVLKDLTLDESKAIFDLLILAVMIDHTVTDDELEGLNRELLKLPFTGPEDLEEQMGEHAMKTRAHLEDILDNSAQLTDFIERATARITTPTHQKQALKMLAVVAYADGIHEDEEKLCQAVGEAFGFDDAEIESILVLGVLDKTKHGR